MLTTFKLKLRYLALMITAILMLNCCNRNLEKPSSTTQDSMKSAATGNHVVNDNKYKQVLNQIIDSADVTGTILILDDKTSRMYSNDFESAQIGSLPASTFKIPNSIVALETGVIPGIDYVFKWSGEKRRLKAWERDLNFREAFQESCVPCYQEIARKVGLEKMKEILNRIDYPGMDVDSSNLDRFWLEGNSKISPLQQIEFLRNFYYEKIGIANKNTQILKQMMLIDSNENYRISGKTGWAIRNGNNQGWFVGYVESANQNYFFATRIQPNKKLDMDIFPKIRKEITFEALEQLNIIR